ncbi:MAG: adenosylmethionine--8-amino-7-oxononanoate aminotransferase BioA, partial [Crocinitomicaceae bacterium]|nr:adenosylmethionine--8-amino-7-oxononanoate aminotransferase BioA [Crocinitomicaceae bacterium]
NHPKVKSTRQQGIIYALDLNLATERYGSSRYKLFDFYMSKGVFLRPLGNTVYILAPYVISKKQLNKVYSAIEDSLESF